MEAAPEPAVHSRSWETLSLQEQSDPQAASSVGHALATHARHVDDQPPKPHAPELSPVPVPLEPLPEPPEPEPVDPPELTPDEPPAGMPLELLPEALEPSLLDPSPLDPPAATPDEVPDEALAIPPLEDTVSAGAASSPSMPSASKDVRPPQEAEAPDATKPTSPLNKASEVA
jgi:hypothetical protein